jgi:hypothetical protein
MWPCRLSLHYDSRSTNFVVAAQGLLLAHAAAEKVWSPPTVLSLSARRNGRWPHEMVSVETQLRELLHRRRADIAADVKQPRLSPQECALGSEVP